MNAAPSPHFDPRLESLRGVAALAVVITHSVALLKVDGIAAHWSLPISGQSPASLTLLILSAIFNPGSAVVLFFLLSGFVLSLSCATQGLDSYFVRRLLRLLPPMWASILTMAGILYIFPPLSSPLLSDWSTRVFESPSLKSLASNLLLKQFNVNGVTWTMYVELIGSAFVPLAMYARGKAAATLLLLCSALAWAAYPSLTLSYLVCFQVGVLLARNEPAIHCSWAWVALTIFILDRLYVRTGSRSLLLNCSASYLLIAAIRRGAWSGLLHSKPLRFIGRISFSLYLFHPLVLYGISRYANDFGETGLLPHLLVIAIAIPLSLLLALAAFHLLERPSIDLGKTVATFLRQRQLQE